jgi:pimeloyl-ACP methyl ester carboxylesterase
MRRRGSLQRRGACIAYEVTGAGRPLVFAHGLGGNHASWWQQVAYFGRGYTCVTFAHRGFYPSSALAAGPDPSQWAEDLAALIDHLGVGEVCLIAQSMGGWSAIEYALRPTARLAALVLAASMGSIDPARLWHQPEARQRLEGWQTTSAAAGRELVRRGIHIACGARMAREQPALHLLYRHIDEMNARLDKEALRARLLAARTRAPAELAAVGCPTLLLAGLEDIVVPPFAADALAAHLPRAEVAHIAETGHSAYFERAPRFNARVAQFLASCGWAPLEREWSVENPS